MPPKPSTSWMDLINRVEAFKFRNTLLAFEYSLGVKHDAMTTCTIREEPRGAASRGGLRVRAAQHVAVRPPASMPQLRCGFPFRCYETSYQRSAESVSGVTMCDGISTIWLYADIDERINKFLALDEYAEKYDHPLHSFGRREKARALEVVLTLSLVISS
ncbi:hypothetical protein TRAPUB_1981 [Trametes pubescens]|uniref:Uncharacterized protein n=1 Tax=Trametes pubescens TaxID=154538 RepID=A0A1M2VHW8_TRAPU|nr:hypothetical protein TRAPUB_1981 [Trametes pubescens]